MRALLFCVAALSAACGDNRAASRDAGPADAGLDAPTVRAACLDRPDQLPAAPPGELPCDLLPPGFAP